ncbi:MAG: hypothetical protein RLZZ299_45 [Pseudomonadota bacterium]
MWWSLVLLAAQALAGSVVLVDLDGYGASATEASEASDALRDALLFEAGVEALGASELAERLGAAHAAELAQARARLATGRSLLGTGNVSAAIPAFRDALRAHRDARSEVARRGEIADAAWWLAIALSRGNRTEEVNGLLLEIALWYPGYAEARAAERSPALTEALARAEAALRAGARRTWPAETLREVEAVTGADALLAGAILGDGTVILHAWDDGAQVGSMQGSLQSWPPVASDPGWAALARQAAALLSGVSTAAPAPVAPPAEDPAPPPGPSDGVPEGAEHPAALSDGTAADAQGGGVAEGGRPPTAPRKEARNAPRDAPARGAKVTRVEVRPGAKDKQEARRRAKVDVVEAGSAKEADVAAAPSSGRRPSPPGRGRALAWAGLAVLLGGGTVAAAIALHVPEPVVTRMPDVASVRVETGVSTEP